MASKRGVVLLNVLILLLVMVFVAGTMLQLAMGRTETVAVHRQSWDAKQITESVRTMLESCLWDQLYPNPPNPALKTCACPGCYSGFTGWNKTVCPAAPAVTAGCTGWQTTAVLEPLSPGLYYNVSACWCDPGSAVHGAMAIECGPGSSCGGCGCPTP